MLATYWHPDATFEYHILRVPGDPHIRIVANGSRGLELSLNLAETVALRDLLERALAEVNQ